MSCYYRFLACADNPACEHSDVELDGIDRDEYREDHEVLPTETEKTHE